MRRRSFLACLPAGILVPLLTACTDSTPDSGATAGAGASTQAVPLVPVALEASGAPAQLTVGVVVSLTSAPGEGSQWARAAEGAQVAAYRYRLGGDTAVTITAVDDQGTAEGIRAAVDQLQAAGACGIVLATSGSHVAAGIEEADSLAVPVLLPYASGTDLSGHEGGAWLTGPGAPAVGSALKQALADLGAASPVMVDAGGGAIPGLEPMTITYADGSETTDLATAVTAAAQAGTADAVVVSGPAHAQATVVAALQGSGTALPLVLSPDALSPAFPSALVEAGGSLEGVLTTAGTAHFDPAALGPGVRAGALSSYLAATRLLAQDPDALDLFGGAAFATSALWSADAATHDAVVTLVTACARAGGADPSAVLSALSGLEVTAGNGLAGPDLVLDGTDAVASADVVALTATSQDPGLRSVTGAATEPVLYWFATSTM